jgi:DNA-binding NarL/FixJ family response regulator
VLSARCVETELSLGLVGLSDLLHDAFPAAENELADHQRVALAVAIGLEAPGAVPTDGLVLSRACLALVQVLARKGPVLIALDDVQWLDEASRRILSFAVRRLSDEPVGVLVTQRGEGPDALGLTRGFEGRHFQEICLGGLSIGALAHLIRRRGGTRIPRPLLARIHAASEGNPMFALEFARQLTGQNWRQLGPLPLPTALDDLVRTRVATFPSSVRGLLAVAAAIEKPTPALLQSVEPAAPTLLDEAADAGAVVLEDGIVRFAHPLLASAVYADLAPSQRRALHRRFAELADEIEERARHAALASTEPGTEVAALLDGAASRAYARGAPETAAELAQEAVRLTPDDDLSGASDRALAVAVYLADAGQTADAARWLERVLAAETEGPRRVRALQLRVAIEHDVEAALHSVAEALEHVGDEPRLRAAVLLQLSSGELYRGDLAASEKAARRALAAAEEADEPALLANALATVANRAHMSRRPQRQLMDRALALAAVYGGPPQAPTVRCMLGVQLLREGDLSGARGLLEGELGAAVGAGVEPARARILLELVDLELNAGDWTLAARYLDEIWEVVADTGELWGEAELLVRQARLAALRGEVDAARKLVAEGIGRAESMHWPHLAEMNRWVLGFLELSLGDPEGAWGALRDVARTPTWRGLQLMMALGDAVEALAALGRLEAGDELLRTLEGEARNGHHWAESGALRSAALLLLARRESERALAAADKAADAFAMAGYPLDHGRALLVAGEALRRLGERRRAAERLDDAKSIFQDLGARPWLARVEKELRRASPRSRRDRELTNAERRVAALVADGRTNREVAAQLFTTVATVEAHLTRIYRKAGVRSRTELARRVADGTFSLADE